MSEQLLPMNGDVVVQQAELDGATIYILSVVPGPGQYYLHARDRALAQARAFAMLTSAHAWLADGEAGFALLATPDRTHGKRSATRLDASPTAGGAIA